MKRLLPLLLCLLLLLCGCTEQKRVYTVEQDGMTFTVDLDQFTISDGTYTYRFIHTGVYTQNEEQRYVTIIYPDQSQYEWEASIKGQTVTEDGIGTNGYTEGNYVSGQTLAKAVLQSMDLIPEDPTNWIQILCGLLMIIVSALQMRFPTFFWHLKHFLSVEGGEPSEFYLSMCHITGVIGLIAGVIFLLVGIF